jgi:hypothetical protein
MSRERTTDLYLQADDKLRELKEENKVLKVDVERLDWLQRRPPGAVARRMLGELSYSGDAVEFRLAIDEAMKGGR